MNKQKLTMIELFSGIGSQIRGIESTNLWDCTCVNTAGTDKDAVLSYATIHCGLTKQLVNKYKQYPSKKEMAKQLTEINLGYRHENNKSYDWYKLVKSKRNDLRKYWLATKLTKNLGDISRIQSLPYADLWTISFCCQDISVAGKMKGLKPDSKTRSSLLWENIRLLKRAKDDNTLPKFLMFENVKNLVSKKFINDFDNLLDVLNELGFNSYWDILNAKDCGVPQNRERVFVICIRKDIDKHTYTFPKPFNNGMRLKDVLDNKVDKKYYLSLHTEDRVCLTETNSKNVIGTNSSFHAIRKLTPTECWKLQGFKPEDCEKARNAGISNSNLYKQAGNSIVTNCVELLFEHLYKAQIDNTYICTDELITDNSFSNAKLILAGTLCGGKWDKNLECNRRVYSIEGIAPTITTCGGGNTEPKIMINN